MKIKKSEKVFAVLSDKFVKIKGKGDELYKVISCYPDGSIICKCNKSGCGFFHTSENSVTGLFFFRDGMLKEVKFNRLGISDSEVINEDKSV